MGKKRYDSSSGMDYGGGNRTGAKANPLVGHTDTKKFEGGYDPGGCTWSGDGKGNVKESRLNAGGSRAYMGSRRKPKMTY